MNHIIVPGADHLCNNTTLAKKWLFTSAKIWIALVLIGQWIFALYIFSQFTQPLLTGQIDESRYAHMIRGYVNGDTINNLILLIHVIPIMLISVSGILQLIPAIRVAYPVFHRINGRFFFSVGIFAAVTGLYLTWITGSRLSIAGALGVTINGLLIPFTVYFAWQSAIKKQFAQHQRFAVHAFILINGVWSFRLFLMGWLLVNQGRFGNSPTLDGPADIGLSFASYLLPMLIAELYFHAQRSPSLRVTLIAAIAVSVAALITIIGITAATIMLWGPRITGS